MKMKFFWQELLLVGAAILLITSVAAVSAMIGHLQYIVEPTGSVAAAADELIALADEWNTTQQAWTLGGFIQETTMRGDDQAVTGRVTLYGENGLTLQPQTLLYGRLFTEEELTGGASVALLDEQLALALYKETDAVGRTLTANGAAFQVIGVVQHMQQPGDATAYGAYIPLLSGLSPDALVVEAAPISGVGADVSFSDICRQWCDGGTFINLHKEATGATMWARVLVFAVGAVALIKGIRWLTGRVYAVLAHFRKQLESRYARQLLPQMIGAAFALVLGFAAAAVAAVLLLDFLLQPVYLFPEYIPAVLVEWEEITAAYWRVHQSSANYHELRTPELIRLRYYTGSIQVGSAVLAIILARLDTLHHKTKIIS